MGASYDEDVVAWAKEQAALLRAGRLSAIDVAHIAEEIEDVGKRERRELANCMTALLAGLLRWQFQRGGRNKSGMRMITVQRKEVAYMLTEAPSLRGPFSDAGWMNLVWEKALAQAVSETGLNVFPEACTWTMEQMLDEGFLPD